MSEAAQHPVKLWFVFVATTIYFDRNVPPKPESQFFVFPSFVCPSVNYGAHPLYLFFSDLL